MTVALLTSYSATLGGAERALLEFAAGLEAECWLACPAGSLADAGSAAGLRIAPVREHRPELRATASDRALAGARLAAHGRELARLSRDLDPDVIVASGMRSMLALAAARGITAPIVFLHNDMLPGRAIGAAVRLAARRAALVIVPSATVAADFGSGALVINPAVDAARFAALAPHPPNGDPPVVLVLGAIVGWKRPDLALEALALARTRRPDVRLRLVGAPLGNGAESLLSELRTRASRPDLAGSVEFVGQVADPRQELERASLLLHCADREPFGLAVVEALAAGRPAVVPATSGPAEIVDGECALTYPPGDPRAAADAIVALLDDPEGARKMGAHGRQRVTSRFDAAASRRSFAAAVAPLIGRRPDRSGLASRLALVTVTRNSASELDALLRSVQRHLPGAHVVVVDNASEDDTLAVARRWGRSAAVTVESGSHNVGFGAACNRGVALASEPVVALVNPDVELLDASLLTLVADALHADGRLLAPLVLSSDGTRQDSVHPLPGSVAALVRSLVPPAAVPGRPGALLAPWRSHRAQRVGWAVGCALVASTTTLRDLGPFDESLFLYAEDLDLCIRAGQPGIETWFRPDARVLHHGAHSTAREFGGEPFERLAAARHDVIVKRLGARAGSLDDAAQLVTFASRIAIKGALGRAVARERAQLAALLATRRR